MSALRQRLAKWALGDRDRLWVVWQSNVTPAMEKAAEERARLYAQAFPDEPPKRIEFEAMLDVLALSLRKKPTEFLAWLREFHAAVDGCLETWPR